jgi:hypothetical protein
VNFLLLALGAGVMTALGVILLALPWLISQIIRSPKTK